MAEFPEPSTQYRGQKPRQAPAVPRLAQELLAREEAVAYMPGTFIHGTLQYMTGDMETRASVDEAARVAGMSKFHFIRRFHRETGMTPGEFLLRYRILRAMDLLVTGGKSIAAVGRAVGYDNAAAFSRAFLKIAGMSPRAYRRENRK